MLLTPQNPNDISADIYDIVSRPLKGQVVTDAEIKFIQTQISPPASVLDIGAGTGRHTIPLTKLGYEVTAIESGKKMIGQLQQKLRAHSPQLTAKAINTNISQLETADKFDLIIMMWNAFNEIALTEQQAHKLLTQCKALLAVNGKILINMDDPEFTDFSKLDFTTLAHDGGTDYQLHMWAKKYSEPTNTTVSCEEITVLDNNGKVLRKHVSEITQRWWRISELETLAQQVKLNLQINKLANSQEYYLILTK